VSVSDLAIVAALVFSWGHAVGPAGAVRRHRAALGAGMMADPAIPARIRRLINVESGLNDGIATPFVLVALAGAATGSAAAGHSPAASVAELALGVVVGVAVGGIGGLLVNAARGCG
jgi:NhaP-type Na+/H+ or K+/H+ antiporter